MIALHLQNSTSEAKFNVIQITLLIQYTLKDKNIIKYNLKNIFFIFQVYILYILIPTLR